MTYLSNLLLKVELLTFNFLLLSSDKLNRLLLFTILRNSACQFLWSAIVRLLNFFHLRRIVSDLPERCSFVVWTNCLIALCSNMVAPILLCLFVNWFARRLLISPSINIFSCKSVPSLDLIEFAAFCVIDTLLSTDQLYCLSLQWTWITQLWYSARIPV
jgi:hypothetical protein